MYLEPGSSALSSGSSIQIISAQHINGIAPLSDRGRLSVEHSRSTTEGDPNSRTFNIPPPIANVFNIYWFGITVVLGGQFIYWNLGLMSGLWSFLLSTFLVGSGYICLTLCLAEMASILPFAGGSYGYVRCTLGPIAGYLAGCCESMEYIFYVATALAEFGRLISIIANVSTGYEPLYWFLFYCIALLFHIRGGVTFWRASDLLGVSTLLLAVVYLLSSASVASFDRNAAPYDAFRGSGASVFMYFPLSSWFFVGVETMTLTCESVPDPTYYVPKAMVWCMGTLFVSAICIIFTVASVAPGLADVLHSNLPLTSGYEQSWSLSSKAAKVLMLPAIFSTAFGFMFAYGKQIFAMSRSRLLPAFLSRTSNSTQTPSSALVFGSLCGLAVLLFLSFIFPNSQRELFSICMLGSCSVYVSIFRAYMVCADRYGNLERQFVSPLGKAGAVYGIVVFSTMVVSLAFFQKDNYVSFLVFLSFLVACLVYYFAFVRKSEFFSDEEQRQFWKAYLLNISFNRKQRRPSHVAGGADAFMRVFPIPNWIPASGAQWVDPFPLPSGRQPSKKDPKVNPFIIPSDDDSSCPLDLDSRNSTTPTLQAFDTLQRATSHDDQGPAISPSRHNSFRTTPGPYGPGVGSTSRSSSHGPDLKRAMSASSSTVGYECAHTLLAVRIDWGDQRFVLTETATTCLYSNTSNSSSGLRRPHGTM